MEAAFSKAREISHSAVAVVGTIAGFQALIVAFLVQVGVSDPSAKISFIIGGAGSAVALLSKGVDSLNNAVVTGKVTPPAAGGNGTSPTPPAPPAG